MSKHAVRLLNHPEPANGDRCRRLLLPERSSLDAARRQTYARAQEQGWRLGSCFWRPMKVKGAGQNISGGCYRSGGRCRGAEIASCELGSARRGDLGPVFARICAGVIVAGVVDVESSG